MLALSADVIATHVVRAALTLRWRSGAALAAQISNGRKPCCSAARRSKRPMKLKTLILLLASAMAGIAHAHPASAEVPQGVWLVNGEAAVQIFECNSLLCGRIRWLQAPRDPQGQLKRDTRNPDPALRQRELCGLTVIRDLRSSGPNHWNDGWFYNPDSGKTYNIKMELTSSDALVARFYLGTSLVGETKTLSRVVQGTSEGWC
jgi:uncharacterized protein (DUF2147 family)